ncbi:MAG: DUF4105 domain-containing protein [Gemmatimonadota bacterium]|nr:DUF4105 domain-containing protein [Gemmatimonadota bacterium]
MPALLLLLTAPPSFAAAQEPDSPPTPPNPQDTLHPTPPPPGSSLSVYLLTIEPGDLVYELFGHNALVVRDSETGYEEAFNYGIFDKRAAGFYVSFAKGLMMYRVDSDPLSIVLDDYRDRNRRVWAQELDLEPARKARLLRILQTDVLPENRVYRYHYYLNNCSTKLRDALDTVLDGQLRAATQGTPTGSTWRRDTRRLTSTDAVGYLAIDLALGPKGDEPTDRWEEMWIPMKLRDTAGALLVARADGTRTPLVRSEELWVDSTREHEPVTAPSLDLLFLLCGLVAGLVLSFLGYRSAAGSRLGRLGLGLTASIWGLFCFVAGAAFIGIYWTDHDFIRWNQNVLLFSPLGLGVGAGVLRMLRKGRTSVWGRRFVLGALALAVVALILNLIPATSTGNRQFIAFALPVHLAICWVMLGIHRMDHALVYGDSVSGRGR